MTVTARALLADDKALDDLTEDAINAIALLVQNKIGQTDGGIAGIHFSDDFMREKVKVTIVDYLHTEANFEDDTP